MSVTSDDGGAPGPASPLSATRGPLSPRHRRPVVVVPHVRGMLAHPTLAAIARTGWPTLAWEVPATDEAAYARMLCRLWTIGRSFIVCEQDVVPPPGALARLTGCKHPWCYHAYWTGWDNPGPMLGLVRFDASIMVGWPNLARTALWYRKGQRSWAHWSRCDIALTHALAGRGFRPHRHLPDATHLHDYGPGEDFLARPGRDRVGPVARGDGPELGR